MNWKTRPLTYLLAALIAVSPLPIGHRPASAAPAIGTMQAKPNPLGIVPPPAPVQQGTNLTPPATGTMKLNGPMGTRLKNFRFIPSQPSSIVALFADDVDRDGTGITLSGDLGASWQVISPTNESSISRYYEIAPTDPKIRYSEEQLSLDGGATWLNANNGLPTYLTQLQFSPVNASMLYARGIDGKFYRSTDRAVTWTTAAVPTPEFAGLVADPTNANTLYAYDNTSGTCASANQASLPNCVVVSTNGGTNWTNITPVISATSGITFFVAPLGVAVLKHPSGGPNPIYIAARGKAQDFTTNAPEIAGIYRSLDGGVTWTQQKTGLALTVQQGNSKGLTDYVRIAGATPVDGSIIDASTLYAVAENDIYPAGYSWFRTNRLFRSMDGGATWSEVVPAPVDPKTFVQIGEVAVQAGTSVGTARAFVVWMERLHAVPDHIVQFKNAIYRTLDNGATWGKADSGLSNMGFGFLYLGPDNSLFTSIDEESVLRSADGGATWTYWSDFLSTNRWRVNSMLVNPANPLNIFIGTSEGGAGRQARGIQRSIDGGVTWTASGLGIGAVDAGIVGLVPTSPLTLFAQVGAKLYRSQDGGDTWYSVGDALRVNRVYYNPQQLNILYGQQYPDCGGCVYSLVRSTDGGTTWKGIGYNADVFAMDPNNPSRLYKGSSAYNSANDSSEGIDISDDGGDTWATLQGGAYGAGRRLIGLLPTNPAIILSAVREYSGCCPTVAKMDYSNDGGTTWWPLGPFAQSFVLPGPVTGGKATAFFPGMTFSFGHYVRSTGLDVLLREGRSGLYAYTFDPAPTSTLTSPSVSFASAAYTFREVDKTGTITITLSQASPYDTSFKVTSADGTANSNDYTSINATLTISAGLTTAALKLTLAQDNQVEPDEDFTLEISDVSNGNIGAPSITKITIQDAGPPTPTPTATLAPGEATPTPTATPIGPQPVPQQHANDIAMPMAVLYVDAEGSVGRGSVDPNATPTVTPSPTPFPEGSATPTPVPATNIKITANNVPSGASRVNFSITAPKMAGAVKGASDVANGTASVQLTTQKYFGQLVTADAVDANGANAGSTALLINTGTGSPLDITLAFGPGVAVNCDLIQIPIVAGPPGKFIQINGLAVPAGTTLSALLNDVAVPLLPSGTGYRLLLPMSDLLPTGSKPQLRILANGQFLTCSFPAIEIQALPPAPGEMQKFVGEIASLLDDMSTLSLDINGDETMASKVYKDYKDALLSKVQSNEIGDASGNYDALIAQTGLRGELYAARQGLAQQATAARARFAARELAITHDGVRVAQRSGGGFTSAQDLLANQQDRAGLSDFLGSTGYQAFKAGAGLLLWAIPVGVAVFAAPLALPVTIGALVIATVWSVIEKIQTVRSNDVFYISGISATPISTTLEAGGAPVPWGGGTIDTHRDEYIFRVADIVDVLLGTLLSAFGLKFLPGAVLEELGGGFAGPLLDLLGNAIQAGLAMAGAQPGFGEGSGRIYTIPEKDEKNVSLGALAFVSVNPQGVVLASKGNPGSLQACSAGTAKITVSVDPQLRFLDQKDGYTGPSIPRQASFDATATSNGPSIGCSGFVAFASGTTHSLGLTADGRVYSWGSNLFGALGVDKDPATFPGADTPQLVPGLSNITAIAAGMNFSLALRQDGALFAWGRNLEGQLGLNDNVARQRPAAVDMTFGGVPAQVAGIAAGERHVLAIDTTGEVWSWGGGGYGQLGNGGSAVKPLANVSHPTPIGLKSVQKVAAGRTHSLALTTSGTVYAWGYNGAGQFGNNSTVDSTIPTKVWPTRVFATPSEAAVDIAAGGLNSVILDKTGNVWGAGSNKYGQLGVNASGRSINQYFVRAQRSAGAGGALPEPFVAVAAGANHTVARTASGKIFTWGWDANGQLGNGPGSSNVTVPLTPLNLSGVFAIFAGNNNTFAVTSTGGNTGWGWGDNSNGKVGSGGTSGNVDEPTKIIQP